MRVIVVGAGIAGLTAADAARCAGAEVLVVEARDRIGGRIRTVPLGPGKIDLGGAWVHSPIANPVAEALALAGIATRNDGAYGAPMAVWADGWVEAAGATTVTAALQADWDPTEGRLSRGCGVEPGGAGARPAGLGGCDGRRCDRQRPSLRRPDECPRRKGRARVPGSHSGRGPEPGA
jgi:NAD(P)-binding Rossmann-like domain